MTNTSCRDAGYDYWINLLHAFNHKLIGKMCMSSAEDQKGVNAAQQCFVENQKGAIAIDFVQQ